VPGKLLRIESGALGVRLHDVGNAAVGQPRWPNAPALGDRPEYETAYLDLTNLPTTIRCCLGCRDVREGVPWRVYNACSASMARREGHFIFVRNAGRL
jgi:hypothetical protein